MRVVDTNLLLYAANRDSEFHDICREFIENLRSDSVPSYLSWGICYEFLRVSTHPRVFRSPWDVRAAWSFIDSILAAPAFGLLVETGRHQEILQQTLSEISGLSGSILHDVHTAVLMREHGIREICTRDTHFARFPFVTIVDPVAR